MGKRDKSEVELKIVIFISSVPNIPLIIVASWWK
jgi:hypothetical protein